MKVDSGNTEWGYEYFAAIPYAYWLHTQGELDGTRSGTGSEPFYFFSPDHEINPEPRSFYHTAEAAKLIPNMWLHKPKHDWSKWKMPPYKEHYGKRAIVFDKPTVVIYNRYNLEWDRPPINFFSLPVLRGLFKMLLPEYEVVYFNVRGQEVLEDNAHSMELGDYDMIRSEFPQVRIIHDLIQEHGEDYNTVQLRVFAGCQKFITMNGAPCMMASSFGGENIIYSKECKELWPSVNSFHNWYWRFGNSHIRVVNTHADLIAMVRSAWVDKEPLINILVRCHQRPKGLDRLRDSIVSQGYRNFRIIASYDDEPTWRYVLKYPFTKIECRPEPMPPRPKDSEAYKHYLSPNSYFNELYKLVQGGYVMFMDDDDIIEPGALHRIAAEAKEDELLLWRVAERTGRLIPSDENMGSIVAGDISGIGICFHSKHIPLAQWEPWRRGDYRIIKSLASALDCKWLSDVLTRMGSREDGKTFDVKAAAADMKTFENEVNAHVKQVIADRKAGRKEHKPFTSRLRSSYRK